MTLVDFLLARIADDEAEVQGHCFDYTVWDTGVSVCRHASHVSGYTAICFKARAHKRTVAECTAKRKIVERPHSPVGVLRILAEIYSDHPDYDQTWAPS